VNPKNDSPDHLATYLCHYAREFLEAADLPCRLDVAVNLPEAELTTEARHSVFLAVKEALNNTVRHARATAVTLRLAVSDGVMTIEVSDNGCGFATGAGGDAGNGLRNMAARMQEVGGQFELRSTPGSGTTISLRLRLRPGVTAEGRPPSRPIQLGDVAGARKA
jgi:signal transduction histidine kinase